MDPASPQKPTADLRDYLAEERTFLAWIRTGLTLMGFGFVVARFGLFLRMLQISKEGAAPASHSISPWIGTLFIVVGVAVNLFSIRRHLRLVISSTTDKSPRTDLRIRRSRWPSFWPSADLRWRFIWASREEPPLETKG